MKTIATIATIASAKEQEIITGHYGLPVARLTETPADVIESDSETEIVFADGIRVTIYDSVEPLVEFPESVK